MEAIDVAHRQLLHRDKGEDLKKSMVWQTFVFSNHSASFSSWPVNMNRGASQRLTAHDAFLIPVHPTRRRRDVSWTIFVLAQKSLWTAPAPDSVCAHLLHFREPSQKLELFRMKEQQTALAQILSCVGHARMLDMDHSLGP